MTTLAAPRFSLFRRSAFGLAAVAATFLSACASMSNSSQKGGPDVGLYELRTYTASPGKMAALDARFRDHTISLFKRHGMTPIAFFHAYTPPGQPAADFVLQGPREHGVAGLVNLFGIESPGLTAALAIADAVAAMA